MDMFVALPDGNLINKDKIALVVAVASYGNIIIKVYDSFDEEGSCIKLTLPSKEGDKFLKSLKAIK